MSSIPIPFPLGERAWWTGNGHREEWVTCPECAGTRAVTMILGNGEQYSLHCDNCRAGYEPSAGVVKRTFYEHAPQQITLNRVSVDGNKIRYSQESPDATCYGVIYAEHLFARQEECQAACDRLNEQRNKEERDRAWQILLQNRQKMAWSVHYWRDRAARLRRELATVEARLAVVKQKKGEAYAHRDP